MSILKFCAENNTKEFNSNKALEEASEFMEALLKYQTKHPDNPKRPSEEDILGEYADFIYRGKIVLLQLFPDLTNEQIDIKIKTHTDYKLNKLQEWKDSGMYKAGL